MFFRSLVSCTRWGIPFLLDPGCCAATWIVQIVRKRGLWAYKREKEGPIRESKHKRGKFLCFDPELAKKFGEDLTFEVFTFEWFFCFFFCFFFSCFLRKESSNFQVWIKRGVSSYLSVTIIFIKNYKCIIHLTVALHAYKTKFIPFMLL